VKPCIACFKFQIAAITFAGEAKSMYVLLLQWTVAMVPHLVGALLAFVGAQVYSWIIIYISWKQLAGKIHNKTIVYVRVFIAIVEIVTFILGILEIFRHETEMCSKSLMHCNYPSVILFNKEIKAFAKSTVVWLTITNQWCRRRGCRRCTPTPKSLICRKSWQNRECPGKILKNPGKNGAQPCLIAEKRLHKNKWRPFLEVTPKKVLMMFVGENLLAKVAQLFGQVWGNSSKNLLHTQNFACPYTCVTNHSFLWVTEPSIHGNKMSPLSEMQSVITLSSLCRKFLFAF